VEGTVDFGDREAKVTSDSAKYQRNLAPQEAEQLQSAADPVHMSRAQAALASRSGNLYDAYQYDITVTTEDGKIHTVTLNAAGGGAQLNQIVPGLGNLIGWIDNEIQKIREHQMRNR